MRRIAAMLGMGALCAFISWFLTFGLVVSAFLLDRSPAGDAIKLGLLAAFVPALAGALTGALVGLRHPPIWVGAACGIIATSIVVFAGVWLLHRNSGIRAAIGETFNFVTAILAVPVVLGGAVTAWVRRRRQPTLEMQSDSTL